MLFAAPINMIFEIPPSAPDITENLFFFLSFKVMVAKVFPAYGQQQMIHLLFFFTKKFNHPSNTCEISVLFCCFLRCVFFSRSFTTARGTVW